MIWSPQKHSEDISWYEDPNSQIWFIKDVCNWTNWPLCVCEVFSLICNYWYWKFSKFRIFWLSEQPAIMIYSFNPFHCAAAAPWCQCSVMRCAVAVCWINVALIINYDNFYITVSCSAGPCLVRLIDHNVLQHKYIHCSILCLAKLHFI